MNGHVFSRPDVVVILTPYNFGRQLMSGVGRPTFESNTADTVVVEYDETALSPASALNSLTLGMFRMVPKLFIPFNCGAGSVLPVLASNINIWGEANLELVDKFRGVHDVQAVRPYLRGRVAFTYLSAVGKGGPIKSQPVGPATGSRSSASPSPVPRATISGGYASTLRWSGMVLRRYRRIFERVNTRFPSSIDWLDVLAVMMQESGGNPSVRNPQSGIKGLMQVADLTARSLGQDPFTKFVFPKAKQQDLGVDMTGYTWTDYDGFNPEHSISAGIMTLTVLDAAALAANGVWGGRDASRVLQDKRFVFKAYFAGLTGMKTSTTADRYADSVLKHRRVIEQEYFSTAWQAGAGKIPLGSTDMSGTYMSRQEYFQQIDEALDSSNTATSKWRNE